MMAVGFIFYKILLYAKYYVDLSVILWYYVNGIQIYSKGGNQSMLQNKPTYDLQKVNTEILNKDEFDPKTTTTYSSALLLSRKKNRYSCPMNPDPTNGYGGRIGNDC